MWERLLHRLWIKPKKSTQSSSRRLRKVTKLSFEAFLIVTTLEKRLLENKLINTFYPFDARCVSLAAVSCSCIAGDNISLLYLKNQSSLCCLHFSFRSVSREFITLRISFERFTITTHFTGTIFQKDISKLTTVFHYFLIYYHTSQLTMPTASLRIERK